MKHLEHLFKQFFSFSSVIVLDLDLTDQMILRVQTISTLCFPITYRTINQEVA